MNKIIQSTHDPKPSDTTQPQTSLLRRGYFGGHWVTFENESLSLNDYIKKISDDISLRKREGDPNTLKKIRTQLLAIHETLVKTGDEIPNTRNIIKIIFWKIHNFLAKRNLSHMETIISQINTRLITQGLTKEKIPQKDIDSLLERFQNNVLQNILLTLFERSTTIEILEDILKPINSEEAEGLKEVFNSFQKTKRNNFNRPSFNLFIQSLQSLQEILNEKSIIQTIFTKYKYDPTKEPHYEYYLVTTPTRKSDVIGIHIVKPLSKGSYKAALATRIKDIAKILGKQSKNFVLLKPLIKDKENLEEIEKEFRIRTELQGKVNIPETHLISFYKQRALLVEECEELSKQPFLEKHEKLKIFYETCLEVDKMHKAGYVHLDLKPENILIKKASDGTNVVFLSDFGLSEKTGTSIDIRGTLDYISPAMLFAKKGLIADPKYDLTSLGMILLGMTHQKADYASLSKLKQSYNSTENGIDLKNGPSKKADPDKIKDDFYHEFHSFIQKLRNTKDPIDQVICDLFEGTASLENCAKRVQQYLGT